MAADPSGTFIPLWVSIVGFCGVLATVIGGYLNARRSGSNRSTGLNAPVTVPTTIAQAAQVIPEFTLKDFRNILDTVQDTKERLTKALVDIEVLKRHDMRKSMLLSQAVYWGRYAPGEPPRELPEYLKPFLVTEDPV